MAGEFVRAADVADVKDGEMLRCNIGGKMIALANVAGDFFAFDDNCTHMDYALTWGWLEDGHKVVCGCHYGSFDVRTGEALDPPCEKPVRTYPVRVDAGTIFVDLHS